MTNSLFLLALQAASTESEGGLFDFNATLPLMALQILLLMVVLNTIFYTPVAKVLDERDEYIRANLAKDLAKERKEAQSIIGSSQKEAQEIVAMEIKQAQKDTELLVNEATKQLNSQKEKALVALEEQVNTLSEQIKNKLLSSQLKA
jgi:F-type H+-transporting ATPase subunit b